MLVSSTNYHLYFRIMLFIINKIKPIVGIVLRTSGNALRIGELMTGTGKDGPG
jgi:hypothetical protein